MTLNQITKVKGPGIHTLANIISNSVSLGGIATASNFKTGTSNLHSAGVEVAGINVLGADTPIGTGATIYNSGAAVFTGVITATKFVGQADISGGSIVGTSATFSGNVSIGGTLTYEDVTNIDSVGVVTARQGIEIKNDTYKLRAGTELEMQVFHDGTNSTIKDTRNSGKVRIQADNFDIRDKDDSQTMISAEVDGSVSLSHSGDTKLNTRTDGVKITGGTDISMNSDGTGQLYMTGNGFTGGIALDGTAMNIYHNSGSRAIIFGTNEDEKLRITSGGNVNIGGNYTETSHPFNISHPTKPSFCLHTGTTHRADFSATTGITSIRSYSNSPFTINIGGSGETEAFRIDGVGKVGIGIVSPQTILHLHDSTNTRIQITDNGTGAASGDGVLVGLNGDDDFFINNRESGKGLKFFTGSDNLRLHIDSDGRLLQNITAIGDYMHQMQGAGGTGKVPAILFKNGTASTNEIIGGWTAYNTTNQVASIYAKEESANDDAYLQFSTRATGGSLIEKLRITSAGLVGINEVSPVARLHIQGSGEAPCLVLPDTTNTRYSVGFGNINVSGVGQRLDFYAGDSGNNNNNLTNAARRMSLTSQGRLGIGTITPADDPLTLYDADNNVGMYFQCPATGNANNNGFRIGRNNSHCFIWNYQDAEIALATAGVERLTINHSGGPGITVKGEVATAQDYPVIKPTLDLNFAATKTLDPRIEYYRYGPASYVDENGKVVLVGEDVPRFDHDPDTGECKGLLVEGERINYIPNGVRPGDKWTGAKANSVWTENTTETTAPDGTYTATKWAFTSTDPYLYHQQTLNAGVTYTMSVWVKAGTNMAGDVLQLRMGAAPYSTFANSTIPTDGSWKRLTFTKTIGGSNETNVNVGFEPQTNPSGNPASGDVIYVWGAQLESGTTASSFIPTYGYTQARGPDVVQITGEEFSDFYNQIEGTIFLSASYDTDARAASIVTIDDTSAYANYTEVGYRAGGASSGQVSSYSRTTAGNDQYYKNWVNSATQGNEFKIAFAYKDNDYASSGNGETAHTDNSGTTHKLFDRLKFSEVHTVGHGGVGHYRRLMYYPKRITNSQLKTLTS